MHFLNKKFLQISIFKIQKTIIKIPQKFAKSKKVFCNK